MSWPNGERYLFPHQSLIVTLLLSLVSTLVFSRTGGVLSQLNSFDTQVMVFRHQTISGNGSGNSNNSKTEIADALLRYKGS